MQRIKKIPVRDLIDILNEIYECGVDFVDIIGKVREEQDSVTISFLEEYVNPEHIDTFEDDLDALNEQHNRTNTINVRTLTDDELNDLI